MHTPLCKHAIGEPEEYAAAAERAGLTGITFTCHNPAPKNWAPAIRMTLEEYEEYIRIVIDASAKWKGRLDIRLGLESDYAPGMEQWLEELHDRVPLSFILGSVHSHFSEYQALYFKGDVVEFQRTYFDHLAMAAESGLFDCIAHPDLVKNDFPDDWALPRIMEDIQGALDRIAKAGVAMELNTSGLLKRIREMNPGPEILREIQKRNIPVVIGSDAHAPKRVSSDFLMACDLLEEAGFTSVSYFLDRKQSNVSIAEVRKLLSRPGAGDST